MSDLLVIFISITASVLLAIALPSILALLIWKNFPRLRLRLQKFLLSSAPGESGALEPKFDEISQRISNLDLAVRKQVSDLEREIEAGKKAERALAEILKGLTQSALRADERLNVLELKDR